MRVKTCQVPARVLLLVSGSCFTHSRAMNAALMRRWTGIEPEFGGFDWYRLVFDRAVDLVFCASLGPARVG